MRIKISAKIFAASTTSLLMTYATFAESVDLDNGKAKYEETCIACHGENAKGAFAGMPDLTKRNGPFSKTDADLFRTIKEGMDRPEADMAMPPLGGNPDLLDSDVKDIIAYMRKTFDRRSR